MGVAVDRRLAEPAERVDGLAGKLEQARGRVFFLFFSFFLFFKNEPGAVGTPRWVPPGMGRQKCHFCEKDMEK